jgi:hypothetical protein
MNQVHRLERLKAKLVEQQNTCATFEARAAFSWFISLVQAEIDHIKSNAPSDPFA